MRQPQPAQRSFQSLRHPAFRVYLLGNMLAMMADSIEHVLSYWVLFEKFHDPALGGFAVFSHWLPFLFLSVWSGALADRFDPRRIVQLGMLLFILASLAWGWFFLTDTLEMWHAMVILTVHGLAGVFWAPAGQLLIHDIVGGPQLPSAVRTMATARVLGLVAGPAVGGLLLETVGVTVGVFINALIYLPLTLWLWKAPYGPRFRTGAAAEAPRGAPARGFGDIVKTAREIAGNRTVVCMTLLAGGASLFIGNAHQAQMPEFAHDLGHGSGTYYSLLLAAGAAGALSAGLLLEAGNYLGARPRTAFVLVILWCFAMMGFAAAEQYWLALVILFVAGFVELSFSSMAQALVQLEAPPAIRGRVIGLFNMAFAGLRAFSGVSVGMAGAFIGIHWSLALSAMALLAATLALLAFLLRAAHVEAARTSGPT